jgi:MerR family transcriptional regulator, redox-sensitive transcriptional activator SoxR
MRISEVAQHVGIKPTTIRFYESIGVLPPAHRVNGHRVYGADILDRLTLIRFGLRASFTLKELKDLFVRFNSRSIRRNTAQRKLRELRALRDRIQLTERLLKQIELCHCGTLREVTERLRKSGALDQISSRTPKRFSKNAHPEGRPEEPKVI